MRPARAPTQSTAGRFRWGLRIKLLIPTLLVVNGMFAVIWYIGTDASREGLTAQSRADQRLGAQSLAYSVKQQLQNSFADALTAARLDLTAEVFDSGDPKNLEWYADALIGGKGRYAAMVVTDTAGVVVAASTIDRARAPLRHPLRGRTVTAGWARTALTAPRDRGVAVPPERPAFLDDVLPPGERVAGWSVPVLDITNEVVGALTLLVAIEAIGESLDSYVMRSDRAADSFAMIVDGAGRPVALPPSLPDRAGWRQASARRASATWITGPGGTPYLATSMRIVGAAEPWQWYVVVLSARDKIDAPVRAVSHQLLITFLIATLITSFVVIAIATGLLAPIARLTRAASRTTHAHTFDPIEIETRDEVGTLTVAFNTMLRSLQSYQADLETKVVARTAELHTAKEAVTELLDNMQQAILTVGPDGTINSQFSAFTRVLFETEPCGAPLLRVLQLDGQDHREEVSRMRFWLANIHGADDLQWTLSEGDPVRTLIYRDQWDAERMIELSYRPIYKDEVVTKVMVIAADVTELRDLEREVARKAAENEANLARVTELASLTPELFETFRTESRELLARADQLAARLATDPADAEALAGLLRAMHTLKGNARIFKLASVQTLAHQAEDDFAQIRDGQVPGECAIQAVSGRLAALRGLLEQLDTLGERVLKISPEPTVRPPRPSRGRTQIIALQARARDAMDAVGRANGSVPAEVRQRLAWLDEAVQDLGRVNLGDALVRFRAMAADIAAELGKELVELEILGSEIRVDEVVAARINEVVLHAVRNSVDHGIEAPTARAALGKAPAGRVVIRCRVEATELVVEVEDDGRGIDLETVRVSALRKRLLDDARAAAASEAELIELLFAPGFSTAEQVTDISGRGVGLDVVRAMMVELGGSVVLSSTVGQGTRMTLRIGLAGPVN